MCVIVWREQHGAGLTKWKTNIVSIVHPLCPSRTQSINNRFHKVTRRVHEVKTHRRHTLVSQNSRVFIYTFQ